MAEHRRTRIAVIGGVAVVVAVVATAFALGGTSSVQTDGASSAAGLRPASVAASAAPATGGGAAGGASHGVAKSAAGRTASSAGGFGGSAESSNSSLAPAVAAPAGAPATQANALSSQGDVAQDVSDGVTATRVVKTGSLSLRVARGQVQPTVSKLVATTTHFGGYVSASRTDNLAGSPEGEVTLRIPAAQFDTAVNSVEKFGRVTSLTTNAHDVTGRFVDLGARLSALKRTRSTYLTILGSATTIGSTLEVQQHVDDVQQQIEELQGQLKVLRNQSADGTLTVDVSQVGSPVKVAARHHKSNGIGAAWHRSVRRFQRGIDSIVGALGPLVLVLLILAVLLGIGIFGYRGVRRAAGKRVATGV
jgi:Domain of unknown function (DUF4349)